MGFVIRFLRDDAAATAVEYSVMLAMILLLAFAAISAFGGKTSGSLERHSQRDSWHRDVAMTAR